MTELEKAYESIEMLKALDLPLSKVQIEKIWSLEKYNGRAHREDLWTYFYGKCFAYYARRIQNIKQAKIRGEVILAKPVLLLTIIEGIDSDIFIKNKFPLSEWLEPKYVSLMQSYMRKSQFSKPACISNPYWHLQSDGFWHLKLKGHPLDGITPSKAWLKDNVEYAYFDESLWMLLQNKVWRMKLRDYIVEHKLTDDSWNGRIVAEALGAIAALLLVA